MDRDEEYTGFNAQADPEFLYAEDDQLISEATRDLYSDLETISVEPKKYIPFLESNKLNNEEIMETKPTSKLKFVGIQNGNRTIEVVNPEFKSFQRKSKALERSLEIWKKRFEAAEEKYKEFKKVEINTPAQSEELKSLKARVSSIKKQLDLRIQQITDLGEIPPAIILKETDVKASARDIREYEERKETNNK